jgi:adenine-specific DNA-methyltransferase
MDKLKMTSMGAVPGNVAKIAALFPNCVTEVATKITKPDGTIGYESRSVVDFDKLKEELSDELVEGSSERYQFTWPDKRAANHLANTPTTMTLRPCEEESVGKDGTPGVFDSENLYIEGDNLDVLKVLRETYLGKVKMIYIDPPYNTGNDFVYNDDFTSSYDEFAESCKVYDEDGNLTFDPKANNESNGRFHTDWLNMIYPRLKVARELLTEDGSIFISIDDNEVENLRKVCDEIFGQQNLIANMVWQSTPGSNTGIDIITVTETILVYGKNKNMTHINTISVLDDSKYVLRDEYESRRGRYILNKLDRRMTGPHYSEALNYPITAPDGSLVYPGGSSEKGNENWNYRWSQSKVNWGIENGFIVFKNIDNKWNIYFKQYFKVDNNDKAITRAVPYQNLILSSQYNTSQGTAELFKIFNNKYFDYAKPVGLIKHCLGISSEKEDFILDFFSGSATTAHAVMKLNAEDGGHRKFIMVQLPEVTDEKSEARKAGYNTICEIGKERIRRAGRKIKEEAGLPGQDLDIGFRVLKLADSNMEDVFYAPDKISEGSLFVDNVKADRTSEDLLFQVMLQLGIELSSSIEKKKINGKEVFSVRDGFLMATFDENVDEATITEIAQSEPVYFVMRDASAANDNVLDNFEQLFRHYSPDTIRRIL